jgi:16S rRNA (guanine527-N7)-methyltransferase
MSAELTAAGERLNALLALAGLGSLEPASLAHFEQYLALLVRWNARINLTAIRDPEQILSRHFVESIACARVVPAEVRSLLDFGSGAGFPGIPIAICRPDIAVTLAESRNKKAAFLRECVRSMGLQIMIHGARAEALSGEFDCVTLRAVDRMGAATEAAGRLVRRGGWLAVMSTMGEFPAVRQHAGVLFQWQEPIPIPSGGERIVALAVKVNPEDGGNSG